MLKTIDRYFQTIRHLRAIQIYGRIWFKLKRVSPNFAPAPPIRSQNLTWTPVAKREPSLLSEKIFFLLNQKGDLDVIGWNGTQRDKLWRYNQHYFDDLNARDGNQRMDWHEHLIERWILENPPGYGTGWDPYPTSLRIVNWIKWSLGGGALTQDSLQSLAIQARWLSEKLEYYLQGNHLLSNAKALIFAGLFFEGSEADGWLNIGLGVLADEISEQILADGGHFERSTMYHALALEDILDICNLTRSYKFDKSFNFSDESLLAVCKKLCEDCVLKMTRWLKTLQHRDGEISFFNDSAFGVAPSSVELEDYATRLGLYSPEVSMPVVYLQQSGYVRLEKKDAVALIDMAPIGPDHIPGHAHADTLSFEFSLGQQRLIVNGGTSVYGIGLDRQQQRSTRSHSTLVINRKNSSDVWAGFRVARRARVFDCETGVGDTLFARAAHDGYSRFKGGPVHRREWRLSEGAFEVKDVVTGSGPHLIEIFFNLGPGLTPRRDAERLKLIEDRGGLSLAYLFLSGQSNVHFERKDWHPFFGKSVPTWSVVVRTQCILPFEHHALFQWSSMH